MMLPSAVDIGIKMTANLMPMYTRSLKCPKRSFFLFGPRAVGKSTWLRQSLPGALFFNLLQTDVRFALLRDPSELRRRVAGLKPGAWIVLDEVQLVPAVLSEVHGLIEDKRYKFALSGSSARKIKRGDANLLAGRAIVRNMFPLTYAEIGDVDVLPKLLERGSLPLVTDAEDDWVDVLEAYALTYLREEIQAEALVRNLGAFSRFLACAALANAQVTNLSSLSRDAGVQRPTAQGYFRILEDTLVGFLLPSYRPRARIKEQAHPKFYWFDAGVARAMAGRLRTPVEAAERGAMLETFILHELRAHLHYGNLGGQLAYWRTSAGVEVDFILSSPTSITGIEVKATRRWRKEHGNGLRALAAVVSLRHQVAVYLGDDELQDGDIRILPLARFLEALHRGEIFAG